MPNENYRILSGPIPCLEVKKMPNVVISGVYKIENVINHKVYIGQSKNVVSRFKRGHLLPNVGKETILKRAFQKYGYENFTVEMIKETYDLDYWEIFLIQIYHATDRRCGYNMTMGGDGGDTFSGRHHSEETKKLMSLHSASRGKVYTLEQRYAMGSRWRGKHHTEEQKRRMSESCKGINRGPKSKEHKRKIAETLKGNTPWNKGVKMSEEQRMRQREIKRKVYDGPQGELIKQKLREANVGKCWWNNGKIEIQSKERPKGFLCGKIHSNRNRWFTNGDVDVRTNHCLDESYVYGRSFPKQKMHLLE